MLDDFGEGEDGTVVDILGVVLGEIEVATCSAFGVRFR